MSGAGNGHGALAIVLHTHMPYVEGFGTWPFGEEWLWEAIACCYLPLLDLLDAHEPPITLSLTPVLADQLCAHGLTERFDRFIDETRRFTHAEDAAGLRAGGHPGLAAELERAWQADYESARVRIAAHDGDLLRAFARHVSWTSSATHAVLPLVATDAGARMQIETGIASHLSRFGDGRDWRGGFWLPECAHASHLEPILAAAGVRSTCVELTRSLGLGAREHLRPLLSESGVLLFGIDRATMSLVWSDAGYPADGAYRDYHRHTVHHHNPWRNDGDPYDHEPALARARTHASDFVSRTRERLLRDGAGLPGGGLVVCALDTELLGHWWYEGVAWLAAVIEESTRQGLELVRLDDAPERYEPLPVADLPAGALVAGPFAGEAPAAWSAAGGAPAGSPMEGSVAGLSAGGSSLASAGEPSRAGSNAGESRAADVASWEARGASSWGRGGDLSTWSGPAVAEMAFATRAAELQIVAAAIQGRVGGAAVRELLALQASDWAFMITRGLAIPYARERFGGHRAALTRALAVGPDASTEGLQGLASYADPAALLAP